MRKSLASLVGNDSIDGIVGEYLALLQLDAGAYTLGVNSDDGFRATIGANYNDILTQEIGVFGGRPSCS